MSNPMIRIHDLATNEVIDREMTDEEVEQANYISPELAQQKANEAAIYGAKATAKAALLTQLGITEEQAKLLLS